MESYKSEFIDFMVESDVLKFGDFTLKSGRKSPFFMNAGAYVTGSQLKRLGEYYAKAIHDNYGDDFDVLFGPAYKGIPLAVVTAIAYSELYGKEVRYCSDRKEAKDHGADKGGFLGSSLKDGDRVVMIEDVTTSGKSMEETVPKVRGAADVEIVGLMVSLNRMEVGQGGKVSALDEIKEKYNQMAGTVVKAIQNRLENYEIGYHEMFNSWLSSDPWEMAQACAKKNLTIIGSCYDITPKHAMFSGELLDVGICAEDEDGDRFWCHFKSDSVEVMKRRYERYQEYMKAGKISEYNGFDGKWN